jgi:putative heme-binding domain-containing protein
MINKNGKWFRLAISLLSAVGLGFTASAQTKTNSAAQYADFAMSHTGNVAAGRRLFHNEQRLACVKCHTVDGSGGHAGPELANIGAKFPRRELIRSILEPSAAIAVGYTTTIIDTRQGDTFQGVIKQSSSDAIGLMGADGKLVRIQSKDILRQRSSLISLMPEGLQNGLSLQEFSDLISYLETLRQTSVAEGVSGTATTVIPAAVRPAEFPSFFRASIKFTNPLWFGQVPGRTNLFVVLEQSGKGWLVEKNATNNTQTVLFDLSATVHTGPACGLLGMAFHPKFRNSHKFYLQYQVLRDGKCFTIIAERRFTTDDLHDVGESRNMMEIPCFSHDHDGGCIQFGPDGYLYIGQGDSGPQRDLEGHAQDLNLLLGKMLRIDVDKKGVTNLYSVPRENPFRHQPGARSEIYAVGFREPWRFSFDRANGDLWVGDVGQDTYEEIDIVRKGENYGWNVFEGFNAFSDQYRRAGEKFIPPLFSYPHSVGVSITGGYVYRGKLAPKMTGHYIFADFQVRKVWALTQANRVMTSVVQIGLAPSRISSINQDTAGELYLVGYDSGQIYRVDLATVDPKPLKF